MSSLWSFVGWFLFACAVTALVQSLVLSQRSEPAPARVAREAFSSFVLIAGGITVFSVIVYGLEWLFIRGPLA